MAKKPKTVIVDSIPITSVTPQERRNLDQAISKRHKKLRDKYREVHGKVVDFISHSIEDGTLYFTVRFKDKTDFSLRYTCNMQIVGADICNAKTGNLEVIREYMKPIVR
jgi:hypothetical protein